MIFNQLIQTNLRTKELGKKVEYYNRLESTNIEAWVLIDDGNQHGTIVITDNQINGKGRKNNSWSMAPGKGLSFSLILDKQYPNIYSGFISLAAGISVAESLKKRNVDSYLKWPNDIFASDKKLGGILCESKLNKNQIEKIVIGVGINVNETITEHPHEIQNNITTMFNITNHAHQRELIVAEFVNCFERLLIEISTNTNNIIEKWLKHCLHLDSNISFYDNGKIKEGLFVGLDENGFAKIKINEEIQIFNAINLI